MHQTMYVLSYVCNSQGGRNKCVMCAKVAKSINVEVGINMEGWILWEKLMHNSNKWGVEVGKILGNQ